MCNDEIEKLTIPPQIEITPISKAHVRAANVDETYLGKNEDLGRWMNIFLDGGVFGSIRDTTALAKIMYVPEASKPADDFKPRSRRAAKKTYGDYRIRNLLEGNSSCSPGEGKVLHDAFRWMFGDALADAIDMETLVGAPLRETCRRIMRASAEWPTNRVGIAAIVGLLAEMTPDARLSIQPVPVDRSRLGSTPGSENENLEPVHDTPEMTVGQEYVLHVRGLSEKETCFVFEVSAEPQRDPSKPGQTYSCFPTDVRGSGARNWTVRPDKSAAFRITEARGSFAFVALAVSAEPLSTFEDGIGELLGIDTASSRLTSEECAELGARLRQLFTTHGDDLRIAKYSYKVV